MRYLRTGLLLWIVQSVVCLGISEYLDLLLDSGNTKCNHFLCKLIITDFLNLFVVFKLFNWEIIIRKDCQIVIMFQHNWNKYLYCVSCSYSTSFIQLDEKSTTSHSKCLFPINNGITEISLGNIKAPICLLHFCELFLVASDLTAIMKKMVVVDPSSWGASQSICSFLSMAPGLDWPPLHWWSNEVKWAGHLKS